ncbi:MAG: phosphate-starvation-inducible PsiE family protein, partial [Candidatus Methanoperedens sp.]|nr:phosphate-starvation-inducible PsiE family protein [Candidatus Methanoperedens sp.]
LFLLVLIGIELLYTIKAYAMESVIHAEVVLTVAMIAIGRKVIILDIKEISGLTLIGIGAVIIALSVGYYYFKKGLYIDESNPAP